MEVEPGAGGPVGAGPPEGPSTVIAGFGANAPLIGDALAAGVSGVATAGVSLVATTAVGKAGPAAAASLASSIAKSSLISCLNIVS